MLLTTSRNDWASDEVGDFDSRGFGWQNYNSKFAGLPISIMEGPTPGTIEMDYWKVRRIELAECGRKKPLQTPHSLALRPTDKSSRIPKKGSFESELSPGRRRSSFAT
jgi:hypothetical protein